MADAHSWFTYYYWADDRHAPDFARTVEIHRKPGYDPVELFLDPKISAPKLAIGKRLALRKLGFRALMDVIPLDATLVRGSHGRVADEPNDGPLIISDRADLLDRKPRSDASEGAAAGRDLRIATGYSPTRRYSS